MINGMNALQLANQFLLDIILHIENFIGNFGEM